MCGPLACVQLLPRLSTGAEKLRSQPMLSASRVLPLACVVIGGVTAGVVPKVSFCAYSTCAPRWGLASDDPVESTMLSPTASDQLPAPSWNWTYTILVPSP